MFPMESDTELQIAVEQNCHSPSNSPSAPLFSPPSTSTSPHWATAQPCSPQIRLSLSNPCSTMLPDQLPKLHLRSHYFPAQNTHMSLVAAGANSNTKLNLVSNPFLCAQSVCVVYFIISLSKWHLYPPSCADQKPQVTLISTDPSVESIKSTWFYLQSTSWHFDFSLGPLSLLHLLLSHCNMSDLPSILYPNYSFSPQHSEQQFEWRIRLSHPQIVSVTFRIKPKMLIVASRPFMIQPIPFCF